MRDILDEVPFYSGRRLSFSGHQEGPEIILAYEKWQNAMDKFFSDFCIPDHCKVRLAEKTLKGEAAKWWEEELETVDYYGEPNHTWSSMKLEMYEEFVKNAASQEPSKKVSRTKLLEEGENDTESESSKMTPEFHSAQKEVNINFENSRENLSTISGHLESPPKWNQTILSSYEKDMNFTSQESCKISGLDQHVLFEAPRPNQEESGPKPTCSGILIQKGSFESLNQTKPKSEEEVIQVTSQPDSDFAKPDLLALSGVPRSEKIELSDKSSCFEILTHKGVSETLNHVNRSINEGVMDFTSQGNLHLPYLEAHEFGGTNQGKWGPESYLIQLEASKKTPRCILNLWIFGIQYPSLIHKDLLIQIKGAIKVIKLQPFIPYQDGRLEMLLRWFQIIPRNSSYGPKLSRLKNRRFHF